MAENTPQCSRRNDDSCSAGTSKTLDREADCRTRSSCIVYRELAFAYYVLEGEVPTKGIEYGVEQISTETFDYYFNSKREVIHLIPNHTTIIGIYAGLHFLPKRVTSNKIAAEEYLKNWIQRFELFVLSGTKTLTPSAMS